MDEKIVLESKLTSVQIEWDKEVEGVREDKETVQMQYNLLKSTYEKDLATLKQRIAEKE